MTTNKSLNEFLDTLNNQAEFDQDELSDNTNEEVAANSVAAGGVDMATDVGNKKGPGRKNKKKKTLPYIPSFNPNVGWTGNESTISLAREINEILNEISLDKRDKDAEYEAGGRYEKEKQERKRDIKDMEDESKDWALVLKFFNNSELEDGEPEDDKPLPIVIKVLGRELSQQKAHRKLDSLEKSPTVKDDRISTAYNKKGISLRTPYLDIISMEELDEYESKGVDIR